MSADNWMVCPNCKKKAEDRKQRLVKKACDSYGSVPLEEYNMILDSSRKPIELATELREDYDIGIRNDYFIVSYVGSCTKCDFRFSYEYKEKIVL